MINGYNGIAIERLVMFYRTASSLLLRPLSTGMSVTQLRLRCLPATSDSSCSC